MNNILFQLNDVVTYSPFRFKEPLNLTMFKDEQWIVYGPNGAGKSFLAETIRSTYRLHQGQITYDFSPSSSTRVSDNIRYVTFHDQYSSGNEPAFYQLRWNQGLLNETEPTVGDLLDELLSQNNVDKELLSTLHIDDLRPKKIVMLSSGEFRRFQIFRTILLSPRLLIVENPFIGLDEENRKQVSQFLNLLIRKLPLQIILVVSRMIPDATSFTHIVTVNNGQVQKMKLEDFTMPEQTNNMRKLPENTSGKVGATSILSLRDVTIRYGERTILKNLNWEVRAGEKWALGGPNGAGKSTLLSLVCADNPQSYACDITLFGNRRGSGESIWDIKKHIGYVSPEMYRTYRKAAPVKNIVASGLYDRSGLNHNFTDEDYQKISPWLHLFNIEALAERNYMQLSGGEQRLVLLCRAFVKDPDLLVLDEPFHGLDSDNRRRSMAVIDDFCAREGKTLIMVSHYVGDFPSCITNQLQLIRN